MLGWKGWTALPVLCVGALATFVIGGLSIWFVDDPFPYAANVLITTFAAGMTILAVSALVLLFRDGNRVAWFGLWAYPAFFVSHVALLGTFVPDLVFAVVAAGALALTWPGVALKSGGTTPTASA